MPGREFPGISLYEDVRGRGRPALGRAGLVQERIQDLCGDEILSMCWSSRARCQEEHDAVPPVFRQEKGSDQATGPFASNLLQVERL